MREGDLELPADIRPLASALPAARPGVDSNNESSNQPVGQPRRIFLTGATGYLGRYILAELLAAPDQPCVVCLVRAENAAAGMQRLQRALAQAGRHTPSCQHRIEVACGSLGAPQFGLGSAQFIELASKLHLVVHAGARVDLVRGYECLRETNVFGTVEVIRLASQSAVVQGGARVVFASTSDVVPHGAAAGEVKYGVDQLAAHEGGYAASKLAGELLVGAASVDLGMDCCVVRLGMLGGDSLSGHCNPADFCFRLIIGIAHAGAFPEVTSRHTMVHSLPVDVAAKAIVELADSRASGVVHLQSGASLLSMAELFDQLASFGPPFEGLPTKPFAEWVADVEQHAKVSLAPALGTAKFAPTFPAFNLRPFPVERVFQFVGKDTASLIRQGSDPDTLKKCLAYIFHGPCTP
jgi:thioester reductase-like protein